MNVSLWYGNFYFMFSQSDLQTSIDFMGDRHSINNFTNKNAYGEIKGIVTKTDD